MPEEALELRFQEAEEKRVASERAIEANIRIKERIEAMEQNVHNIHVSVDALTRKVTEFLEKHGKLQREVLLKLNKYMDDWVK